jgi:hypothetical protein
LSPKTNASNFPDTRGKPNKKATNKIKHFICIAKAIKEYTQLAKEMKILNMEMT